MLLSRLVRLPPTLSPSAPLLLSSSPIEKHADVKTGRYGCIGKNLALMELRTVAALLMTQFDISFAPGEDGNTLLEKSEDYFTIGLSELMLVFKAR